MWCGGVTSSTARVGAKVTGSANIRVAYATNADLTGAEYTDAVATANNYGICEIAGLASGVQHWYAVEDNGVLDTTKIGTFKTRPQAGSKASFSFIASGDSGQTPEYPGQGAVLASTRISNSITYDYIRTHSSGPLFFLDLGDTVYYDPGSGVYTPDASPTTYRRIYDDIHLQPRRAALYQAMPFVYVWDDHDFGPNDSDRTAVGRNNACLTYRERVPSYPLPAGIGANPIYQAWMDGRVQFIMSDTRSDRSPNSDPDNAAKTMLGTAQKSWMRGVLESSTAEFLVWVNPTPWLGTVDDSWSGGFTTERDEIAQMLIDTVWASRMICITADSHALGICSPGNNPYGGFAIYQCAPIDAAPSTASGSQYDVGWNAARQQYATFDIEDVGDRITVTGTGWVGTSEWLSYSVSVDLSTAPPTAPDPVATAEVRSTVTWYGCNLVTGDVIAELPDIEGQVSRALGAYTSTSLRLPIPLAGPCKVPLDIVEAATKPGDTMVVAVVNNVPTWGGAVVTRQGGTDGTLELACVSLEGLLDRSWVGNHAWTAHDEASVIAAGLIADANLAGANFIVDAPATGVLRNRVYYDKDDATVYSRLRELMGVQGGPEFTVDLDWKDANHNAFNKIVRIRSRIGKASASPDAVFTITANSVFSSTGSSEGTYTYTEDYSDGKGSRYVVATGTGEGEARPQATASAVGTNQFRWEHRFSPSTSVSDVATLAAHAQADLTRLYSGSVTWQIEVRRDATPQLNVDWALGDDVAWDLVGHRHPDGIQGQGRVIAYDLDVQSGIVRPILLEPNEAPLPIDEEKLVKSGTVTGTPNSSGYLTVTHEAGFTPAAVHPTGEAPITGSNIPTGLIVDTITETTFRVRCINQSGSAITTSVTLRWTAVEG